MHGLKKTDSSFDSFGEIYFSTVLKDSIKAWKLHKKMTLNLVVPIGSVMFCFYDNRENSKSFKKNSKIILSQKPYSRLTVPPGIWYGFKGLSNGTNLICNISDIPHHPDEIIRKEINEIKIDWSI